MTYEEATEKVAEQMGLPKDYVKDLYRLYWKYVRFFLTSIQTKDISEEDFNKQKHSINIPSLGKFNCSYDRIKAIKANYKYSKKIKEKYGEAKEDQTDV